MDCSRLVPLFRIAGVAGGFVPDVGAEEPIGTRVRAAHATGWWSLPFADLLRAAGASCRFVGSAGADQNTALDRAGCDRRGHRVVALGMGWGWCESKRHRDTST